MTLFFFSFFFSREWVRDISKCIVNDDGFVKWDKPEMEEELGEIVDSFKRQKEIISNRKKNLVKLQMTQKLGEKKEEGRGHEKEMFLVRLFFFVFYLFLKLLFILFIWFNLLNS